VENGTRALTMDFIRGADRALETGGVYERIAVKLGAPSWLREWIEIEREATALCGYEVCVLPGLVQTEAYARAVLGDGGVLDRDEVDQHVAARLDRQSVLVRERPPKFTAVLDEGALRRPIGGPVVMREQLQSIVKLCAEPHVRIHIVRTEVGAYAGLNGPFVVATLPDETDVVYLDNQLRGQVVDRVEDVRALRRAWESVRSEALPHRQSTELILEVAESWT
jgi:hypothetical protein